MRSLHDLPLGAWRQIRGVFTDIDDTLTTNGIITPDVLQALHDLRHAGLIVIAVTGRPAGWSEPFALRWPLHAIVAENGAVALMRESVWNAFDAAAADRPMPDVLAPHDDQAALRKLYQQDRDTREANARRLTAIAARILREVPGAALARDSAERETDIAIDHGEFERLDDTAIDRVVAIMRTEGLSASMSSIHINGWLGAHNKWQGARWIARELLGCDLSAQIRRWLYVGDSPNDQLMFQHFEHSVGVANIQRYAGKLTHWPPIVTASGYGAGFVEVVERLLAEQPENPLRKCGVS